MTYLGTFKRAFAGYEEFYTVIGGTACQVNIESVGGAFRATRDLDVVVLVDAEGFQRFGETFWSFVRDGEYEASRGTDGEARFYRFQRPKKPDYPKEIELFSRATLDEPLDIGRRIVPVSLSEGLSSLSAIMLDDDYYHLLKQGRRVVDGMSVLGIEWLIPFKMKARIDLVERSLSGERIDSRDLKKHQLDVFRLWEYADTEMRIELPASIAQDVAAFLAAVDVTSEQLGNLGIKSSVEAIVDELKTLYGMRVA